MGHASIKRAWTIECLEHVESRRTQHLAHGRYGPHVIVGNENSVRAHWPASHVDSTSPVVATRSHTSPTVQSIGSSQSSALKDSLKAPLRCAGGSPRVRLDSSEPAVGAGRFIVERSGCRLRLG